VAALHLECSERSRLDFSACSTSALATVMDATASGYGASANTGNSMDATD
jgi:hypothetical protein